MPWSYDSDEDYCPYCEDCGQDCGMHDDIFDDAAETLESLIVPSHDHKAKLMDPWIKTRIPKAEFL